MKTILDVIKDKNLCLFNSATALVGSIWYKEFNGVEEELKYLGKVGGNRIFRFTKYNPNDNDHLTNVIIIKQGPVYRYRSNSKK